MRELQITILLLFAIIKINAQTGAYMQITALDSTAHLEENLFNGVEHIGYSPAIEGDAYFLSGDWRMGSIVYQNVAYQNVFLKYDMFKNQVVIRHYNGYTGINLFSPRVQSFTIENHHFIFLEANKVLATGFYEELATGKVQLFVSRSKTLQENISSGKLEQRFRQSDAYYLQKEGIYSPVKKDKTLFSILADRKSELKSYLKASKIRYKDDPEKALITIVEHYNQLTK